jgi:hypothetical protein
MERDATTDMLVAELRQVIADLRRRNGCCPETPLKFWCW